MIQGVQTKQLRINADERGFLTELLRTDDDIFERFAQAYVALNYPGVVRAWHYHLGQDDLFTAMKGMVKLVLYDNREGSPTKGEVQEFFLGEQNPILVKVPANVIHGYKTIGVEPSLLINFPNQLYDRVHPDEHRLPWDSKEVPYDWALKNH
ncbi:MAG: dTDP-4-dehydrorhamnose 3,5-epimerase family protein [Chloroflexi bacterium]|nr:dTDP-4-dehydrorhamnose 3,5-epimerase family protein [Chloroflexota bacterium]